jgi:hypothetical protein
MPRSASSFSISRYDRPKRRYQRAARTMTSDRNRKLANADRAQATHAGELRASPTHPVRSTIDGCNCEPAQALLAAAFPKP